MGDGTADGGATRQRTQLQKMGSSDCIGKKLDFMVRKV